MDPAALCDVAAQRCAPAHRFEQDLSLTSWSRA
jgi:hypothetical protein